MLFYNSFQKVWDAPKAGSRGFHSWRLLMQGSSTSRRRSRAPEAVAIGGHKAEQGIHEGRMHGVDEGRIYDNL